MTFREFQNRIRDIKNELFHGSSEQPLDRGIERAYFNEKQLERMVAIAGPLPYATAKRRFDAWQRQLKRVRETRERMQRTKQEIQAIRALLAVPLSDKMEDQTPLVRLSSSNRAEISGQPRPGCF